jgi:hypothetical protein
MAMTALDSRAARLLSAATRLPSVVARCEDELTAAIARSSSIRFAMLSHADGGAFVARAIDGDTPTAEAAHLTNDLLQISQGTSRLFDIGDCRHVALQFEFGAVVVARVPATHGLFVLTLVGGDGTSMGMTLHLALDLAQRMAQTLESVTPKSPSP